MTSKTTTNCFGATVWLALDAPKGRPNNWPKRVAKLWPEQISNHQSIENPILPPPQLPNNSNKHSNHTNCLCLSLPPPRTSSCSRPKRSLFSPILSISLSPGPIPSDHSPNSTCESMSRRLEAMETPMEVPQNGSRRAKFGENSKESQPEKSRRISHTLESEEIPLRVEGDTIMTSTRL